MMALPSSGMARANRTLVLALGNDIRADDGVGPAAARLLQREWPAGVDIVTSAEAGLALVELLEGYEQAVLIDSIKTGEHPPGTIREFEAADFRKVVAPSPHYAGLPEVLDLAARLGLAFPRRLRIFALEVADPFSIHEGLSPPVQAALGELVRRVRDALREFGVTGREAPPAVVVD